MSFSSFLFSLLVLGLYLKRKVTLTLTTLLTTQKQSKNAKLSSGFAFEAEKHYQRTFTVLEKKEKGKA